jgi:hypothetical protein
MSRINYKYANSPVVFVAPHAHPSDDHNTDKIVLHAASSIDANYIINRGFRRSLDIATSKDIADCNNRIHCLSPEVEDEFLIPYVKMCKRALKYFNKCFVVWIHGVSNNIRQTEFTKNLDMIIGYGLGKPNSLTCYEGIINKFIYEMKNDKIVCFVGGAGGRYSGYDFKNMNQYWRKYDLEESIQSFQLEIIKELREDKLISELTGVCIANSLKNSIEYPNFKLPQFVSCKYI